jgi:hypothetical protein
MSNQIVISSGAKVRELEGVLTGTSGIVNALGINVPSGIPQLDGSGKILVSQLPNSVMEYKGSWNAATNTPTLVNGTGNAGDVYLCEVAGTVNFGAGPITFAVGDQVIYSGAIWQRASGATGTVTSVAVSRDGDALTITGSPITTSGTINIGFTGSNGQYINGEGDLVTFPSLTGFVPYTGATSNVDLGSNGLIAGAISSSGIIVANGLLGALGGLDFQKGNTPSLFTLGDVILYSEATTNNVVFRDNASKAKLEFNNSTQTYTFPEITGTLALLEGAQTFSGQKTFSTGIKAESGIFLKELSSSGRLAGYVGISATATGGMQQIQFLYPVSGSSVFSLPTTGAYNYEFPIVSGTVALTSDLGAYVTLGTTQTITGAKTFSLGISAVGGISFPETVGGSNYGGITGSSSFLQIAAQNGSAILFKSSNNTNAITISTVGKVDFGSTIGNGTFTYTLPSATGTLALTSDIPSVSGTATYIPVFTSANSLGNSQIWNNGGIIGMGTNYSSPAFSVVASSGDTFTQGKLAINTTSFSGTSVLQVNGAATITGGLTGTSASFTTSGGSDTFAINHSSGSGIALNITKGGNGEGLYINKTSGSGNAATIIGTLNATTLVKSGGTSSQFLMADGSVNTSVLPSGAYLPLTGGTLTGALSGTSATFTSSSAIPLRLSYSSADYDGMHFIDTRPSSSSGTWRIGAGTGGVGFGIYSNSLGATPFFLSNSTGAATFSSSVNVNGATANNDLNVYNTNNAGISLQTAYTGTTGSDGFYIGQLFQSTNFLFRQRENADIIFETNNGSERMRITSGGNVLIGTTSGLSVFPITISGDGSTKSGAIQFKNNGVDVLYLGTPAANDSVNIQMFNPNNGYIRFATNSEEKIRITSGGFLKASNTGSYNNVAGNYHEFNNTISGQNNTIFRTTATSDSYGPWIYFSNQSPNNTTNYFLAGTDNTNDKFFIYSNGSMFNKTGTYGTISDVKFKENIVDATPKLADLIKLKVRNFNMIGDETKQIGFIAQEFEEVFPSMVDTNSNKDGETHKAIKTSVLVPMLVKAIQEQQAQIEELSNKIVALESK